MAVNHCVFKRTLDGSAPTTKYIKAAGSEWFQKGELVCLSSGYLTAAVDGGSTIIGVTEATVDNGSGAAGAKEVPVNVNLQSVYEGTLDVNSSQVFYGRKCEVDSGTVIDPSDAFGSTGTATIWPLVMCLGPIGTASDKRQEFVILPGATGTFGEA